VLLIGRFLEQHAAADAGDGGVRLEGSFCYLSGIAQIALMIAAWDLREVGPDGDREALLLGAGASMMGELARDAVPDRGRDRPGAMVELEGRRTVEIIEGERQAAGRRL
jgi:hypothetical protein